MSTSPMQSVGRRERAGLATSPAAFREHDCDNNTVRETPQGASLESHYFQEAEAEADVKPATCDSSPGVGGSEAEAKVEKKDDHVGVGNEEESESPSETGAVHEVSSEDEGKDWATPRILAEDTPACPLTIAEDHHRGDLPLNAISWRDESHPQWVRVRSVMDSGAAQSVAPPSMASGVLIEASPGSQRGQQGPDQRRSRRDGPLPDRGGE